MENNYIIIQRIQYVFNFFSFPCGFYKIYSKLEIKKTKNIIIPQDFK